LTDYLVIILPASGGWGNGVPLLELAHSIHHTNTPDIGFLLAPVPLFRVPDANSPHLPYILYHNTFFRFGVAVNLLPTAAGASVHVKEFVYTTLGPYGYSVQSGSDGGDKFHPQHHNTHKHTHDSDHDEQYPP